MANNDISRSSSFEEAPASPDPPKKQSWWKKLIPSCGTNPRMKSTTSAFSQERNISGVATVVATPATGAGGMSCASCGVVHISVGSVGVGSSAFVCSSCSKVNRVVVEDSVRRLSVCQELTDERKNRLIRTGSTTFESMTGDSRCAKEGDLVVPQCQVCMDGPGDMVLLPCGHGAVCEPCAKHIAKNMSVGGNHCVRCRSEIKKLVRLDQLYKDQATGVTVVIPSSELRKGPPKVPPPPGLNKSKHR